MYKNLLLCLFGIFITLSLFFWGKEDRKEMVTALQKQPPLPKEMKRERLFEKTTTLKNESKFEKAIESRSMNKKLFNSDENNSNDFLMTSITEVINVDNVNVDNMPEVFINNGIRFNANLSLMHKYAVNSKVNLTIFGEIHEATIKRHKTLKRNVINTRLEIGNAYPPQYMTLFTHANGRSQGKIYTKKENYSFIHNGKNGFLIEMNKLNALENYPITE